MTVTPLNASSRLRVQGQEASTFPFFLGAPRSGTTLFRAIFDYHPDMAVPDESNFVPVLGRSRNRYERPYGFAASALLNDLFRQRSFRRWGLSQDRVREAFDTHPPADYPDAVRALFGLYAEAQGKSRYADKTPQYVMSIPLLAELFPEAKFIHIIRDGRDVALSALDVDFGPRGIGSAALSWKDFVGEGRQAGERLGTRYCEVRYEEILESPESTLASLCEFIDLAFDPAMLRYFERSEKIAAPAAWSRRHVLLPPTKGLRDWRTQMPPRDVGIFESLAGDLLEELGYERAAQGSSARVRLRSRGAVLGRSLRRLGRSARKSATKRVVKESAPIRLLDRAPGDRQEVVSFLLAEEAGKNPEVMSFREQCLGNRLLQLEQVGAWIADWAEENSADGQAGTLEYLPADSWPLRKPAPQGGVLDRLRLLGARLADIYGWEQSQASTFVLAGVVPLVPAIREDTVGGVPISATTRIVLEIDPVVTPRELVKHYKRVRARVAQDATGGVTGKQCKLAVFVAGRSDAWPDLMEGWNKEFPKWSYAEVARFQRDAVSARRALMAPW